MSVSDVFSWNVAVVVRPEESLRVLLVLWLEIGGAESLVSLVLSGAGLVEVMPGTMKVRMIAFGVDSSTTEAAGDVSEDVCVTSLVVLLLVLAGCTLISVSHIFP